MSMAEFRLMNLNLAKLAYFQGEPIPDGTNLAGWAALVQALAVRVPVRRFSCVSEKHVSGNRRLDGGWEIYDKRYRPEDTFAAHLTFALRHEIIDLLVLKRILDAVPAGVLTNFIQATPNGIVPRRAWFFYETLTGKRLEIEDAPAVTAVDALDAATYFTSAGIMSLRHRVRDNLLGTGAFCPIIRKTDKLQGFIADNLARKARETIGRNGAQSIARAASFLLLEDSRASFAIEGVRAPANRLERWGRAVLEAGKRPLNQTEIYRLHHILIGDDRFTEVGYRSTGVFLGPRDRDGQPLPEFIGARHQDIPALMTGLNMCNNRLRVSALDAVLQAAAIAFGFVYVHPLADGNGRLHRCLIHHVLAERKFTPPGMVFPVSTVMLDRIDDYRETLKTHSAPLMDFIDWHPLANGNVDVTEDTADLYRFYDCTKEAEFLYGCVQRTVDEDLPREIDYLKRHDEALIGVMNTVEMPDRLAQDIIMYIRQNNGTLGRKRRFGEFERLSDDEVAAIEAVVKAAFDGFDTVDGAPGGK